MIKTRSSGKIISPVYRPVLPSAHVLIP